MKLSSRTDTSSLLFFLLVAITATLLVEACLIDARAGDYELTRVSFIGLLSTPCVIPLATMYLLKLRNNKLVVHPVGLTWIVIPAVFFTASVVMYLMIGEPAIVGFMKEVKSRGAEVLSEYRGSAEYVFYILTVIVFRVVLIVEILIYILFIIYLTLKERYKFGNIARFVSKGGSVKMTALQVFFLIPVIFVILIKVLGIQMSLADDRWLCVCLSLVICVFLCGFAFTAMFGAKREVTRKDMRYAMRYNYNHHNKSEVVEIMINSLLEDADTDTLERVRAKIGKNLHVEEFKSEEPSFDRPEIASRIFASVTDAWEEDDLLGRFQKLMRDEMLFLKPGLSLDDVADRLVTNKFYISKMVNNAFNMGFPEVVNILRVDYAEQYIINHPDAKQSEIASRCGFLSASTFNTIFKKVTGMTPKMWVATKEHSEPQQ